LIEAVKQGSMLEGAMGDDIQSAEVKRGVSRHEIAAWILMAAGLLVVSRLRLLSALLAGLLVYELVHIAMLRLRRRLSSERAGIVAVTALAFLVIGVVAAVATGLVALVRSEGHLASLLERLADSVALARANLPSALSEELPANADALKDATVDWLRLHAKEIRTVGADFGRTLVHIVVGLVIGVMVSLTDVRPLKVERPLARALAERMSRLGNAFRRIIFAQVRISVINTFLTATFLLAGLPIFGVHLPLAKTLVVLTFVVGLLPVIGNLISNTVVVVVGLSVSPYVAAAALVFLVVIHKLEYFLNARIVGAQINARAWELLAAMLLMEAAFGVAGVVAAPIYYAYMKDELTAQALV
jgi:predicted PurR-regulated permease PerM